MTVRDALAEAKRHAANTGGRRPGALLIVNDAGALAGIFTDGDLRRLVEQGKSADVRLGDVMTPNPRKLTTESLVRDAVQMVREFRIDEVPVVDDAGKPVGLALRPGLVLDGENSLCCQQRLSLPEAVPELMRHCVVIAHDSAARMQCYDDGFEAAVSAFERADAAHRDSRTQF